MRAIVSSQGLAIPVAVLSDTAVAAFSVARGRGRRIRQMAAEHERRSHDLAVADEAFSVAHRRAEAMADEAERIAGAFKAAIDELKRQAPSVRRPRAYCSIGRRARCTRRSSRSRLKSARARAGERELNLGSVPRPVRRQGSVDREREFSQASISRLKQLLTLQINGPAAPTPPAHRPAPAPARRRSALTQSQDPARATGPAPCRPHRACPDPREPPPAATRRLPPRPPVAQMTLSVTVPAPGSPRCVGISRDAGVPWHGRHPLADSPLRRALQAGPVCTPRSAPRGRTSP